MEELKVRHLSAGILLEVLKEFVIESFSNLHLGDVGGWLIDECDDDLHGVLGLTGDQWEIVADKLKLLEG